MMAYNWIPEVFTSNAKRLCSRPFLQGLSLVTLMTFFICGAYLRISNGFGEEAVHSPRQIKTARRKNLSAWEKAYSVRGVLDLMNIPRPNYLPNYKNPCWIDQRSKSGIRCLPYFFLAGMPKSGTTDLWDCLLKHPNISYIKSKEPHWWTRVRYRRNANMGNYIKRLDPAVRKIESTIIGKTKYHPVIAGDGSASTFWDNSKWRRIVGNWNDSTEPQIITSTLIRHLIPMARIIVIIRNPTDRLFSDYLYFHKSQRQTVGLDDFHRDAESGIALMKDCLNNNTERHCVYEQITTRTGLSPVRLYIGMYSVYVKDWLAVFPRDRLHFVRLEDYSENRSKSMDKVFDFLEIGPMKDEHKLQNLPVKNKRRRVDRKLGKMLNQTRSMIDEFYRPYNLELSKLLQEPLYRYTD